ncbi:MAG: FUSC family protein [Jatrophihabitans sp.]
MTTLRSQLEGRLARLRTLGVRGLLTIEPDTLLRIGKATVAGALAWEVAALMNSPRPVLASLGAILVVQVTVRATLARSIQLTIGVMVGLALSVLIGHVLGIHWWTIGLIVLGGLVVGEIMRLGAFSSQVAISALLAYSLGSGYGTLRAVDTVVGAAIGAAVNALVPPPSQVKAGASTLRSIGEDLGALLGDVSDGLDGPLDTAAVNRWLDRAREIAGSLRRAYETLSTAQESLRFNHRGRLEFDRMEQINEARRALDHATTQTRGLIRTLLEASQSRSTVEAGPGAFRALGPLLRTAAGAVSAGRASSW